MAKFFPLCCLCFLLFKFLPIREIREIRGHFLVAARRVVFSAVKSTIPNPQSAMKPTASQSKRWRLLRRCLIGVAVFLTLLAAFYTVDFWRGKRAWENCKREMAAKGIQLDWAAYIPPPVPDDQNVFAVPEMQQWFLGKGPTLFSERLEDLDDLSEPGDTNHPSTRVVVAEVAFSQPDSNSPAGFTVLTYGDPKANAEAAKLIKDAVGPYFSDPWSLLHLLRRAEEIQPAKILLQCQTAPSAKELEQFLTNGFHPDGAINLYEAENAKLEPAGKSSYKVTMEARGTAAELLARIAVLEPQFAVMRHALQRPYVRILGDNQKNDPDFIAHTTHPIIHLARLLSAQAQCYLLLGRPEEAVRDLTLSQNLCRIVDEVTRGTYGSLPTLIHETVTVIDIYVIADGLSLHAWREPQLAALQEQLQKINFVSDIKQVMLAGPARVSDYYPTITAFNLGEIYFGGFLWPSNAWTSLKATVVGHLIPRGWVYQNMVRLANGYVALGESLDSVGPIVHPKKVDAVAILARSHPSPYNYVARISHDYSKTCRNIAKVQTQIHQALIACALERYRLTHNAYPDSLDALVPQYLVQVPRDIIGGQPLHYRRTDDGKFLLYSIGWNESYDGSQPASDDDWVWDNPRR